MIYFNTYHNYYSNPFRVQFSSHNLGNYKYIYLWNFCAVSGNCSKHINVGTPLHSQMEYQLLDTDHVVTQTHILSKEDDQSLPFTLLDVYSQS